MPATPLPVTCVVASGGLEQAGLDPTARQWAESNGFTGQYGRLLPLPGEKGLAGYLFGVGPEADRPKLVTGLIAAALEGGSYRLLGDYGDPTLAALGFVLGSYRYDRYRGRPQEAPVLFPPDGADTAEVDRLAENVFLARDLINTPTNDMGPEMLETAIRGFAERHGFTVESTVGDELLTRNFPMIHMVGRAGAEQPRLLDLTWGEPGDPRVTLVGKGVTFDTGGLDIKPAAGMLLMKKDMGGAATILGLAGAIASAGLKIRLRVLIPIVENAISSASFRPGDILRSRDGMTVEIGNTDAEGRLILADALALADEDEPELVIDMATLTGAARTALGPELPALYSTDDALARALMEAGLACGDPLWQLPLWPGYDSMLNSKIADMNNVSTSGFAGSIVAALFLKRFVKRAKAWVHLDIMAWAPEAKPGRPFGATDHGLRACYAVLKQRYS